MGFGPIFLLAGCEAIIASPWEIYDSTEIHDLFIRFYRYWIKEGKPLAEALALSQREAIKQGVYPVMWGFPLLIGNA